MKAGGPQRQNRNFPLSWTQQNLQFQRVGMAETHGVDPHSPIKVKRLENNNKWRRGGRIQWKNGFFFVVTKPKTSLFSYACLVHSVHAPFSYSSCLVLNQLDHSSLQFCFPKGNLI
jgi:hypothetical protein